MQEIKSIIEKSKVVHSLKNKKAFITGASSGIGLATASLLAKEGCHLFLVARRLEKLEQIKTELLKNFPQINIQVLAADVKEKNFCKQIESHGFADVDILINNAGLAKGKDFAVDLKDADIEDMIETNNTAAFKISSLVARKMSAAGRGHIVHLGSIAGHFTYEGASVYCATKFAIGAFNQALRQELYDKNVRVTLVSPGVVKTEFSVVRFAGDTQKADSVYDNMKYLEAYDVAESILDSLKKPEHVNIDEVIVMPQVQAPGTGKIKRNS